jgi:hypothetical protein
VVGPSRTDAARGERGANTVRLVLGVIVGILVAELVIAVNGRSSAPGSRC